MNATATTITNTDLRPGLDLVLCLVHGLVPLIVTTAIIITIITTITTTEVRSSTQPPNVTSPNNPPLQLSFSFSM
jgi:hypothetical protein